MVMVTYYPCIGRTYTTRYGRYPHMPLFTSYKDSKTYNARDVCISMGEMTATIGTDQMRKIMW